MHRVDPRIIIIQILVTSVCVFWIFEPIEIACKILCLMCFLFYLRKPKEALELGAYFLLVSLLLKLSTDCSAPPFVERILFLLRKLSPLVGVMMLALKSISVSQLIAGLQRLRCPRPATLALAIALRFIPTIQQELGQIKDAMKTRGIPLNLVTFAAHPVTMTEYMLVPFMMRCVKVGDELSASASTRAIENPQPRGERLPMKIGVGDIVYLSLVMISNVGIALSSQLR